MRKAVFLDRDGTINRDKGYVYRIEDFEYEEGAVWALRRLQAEGFLLVILTNQSGIARGFYTEEDYRKLTFWMVEDLRKKGIEISRVDYCPHLPESALPQYRKTCNCRKPGTGMFWRAIRELGVDEAQSFAVGDRMRDLAICGESGVRGILLGSETGKAERGFPNIVVRDSIREAAEYIAGAAGTKEQQKTRAGAGGRMSESRQGAAGRSL